MLYAMVNNISKMVEKAIVWDGKMPLKVPEHCTLVQSEFCRPGTCYDIKSGIFAEPLPKAIDTNTQTASIENATGV